MAEGKALTARMIERAKPNEHHDYSIRDATTRGLRVAIRQHGTKTFFFRYQFEGRDRLMTLGDVRDLTLDEARALALEARKLLRQRIDPLEHRKVQRAEATVQKQQAKANTTTFGKVAEDWLADRKQHWSDAHYRKSKSLITTTLLKPLGKVAVAEIDKARLLAALKARYDGGKKESARNARAFATAIFEYARDRKILGPTDPNPAKELIGHTALKKTLVTHRAALPKEQVGAFLLALEAAKRSERIGPQVYAATLTAMLTGSREGAVRAMRWRDIDLEARIWTCDPATMKSKRTFRTFFGRLVLDAIKALPQGKPDDYVFVSPVTKKMLSANTLRLTLHRLGFPFTAHGFRSLLVDWSHEQGKWSSEVIARLIDHALPDLQAAYNRTEFDAHRRELLNAYNDWCEAQLSEEAAQ